MTTPERRQERNDAGRHRYGTRANYEKEYNEENHADIPCCTREPYSDPPREELVNTERFDDMKLKYGYVSNFERLAWTEQQERTFAFRLMKYGKMFRKIAWEEKDVFACVRYYYTAKYTGWFKKIVEDVKAAEALLLLSRPVSQRIPIEKCFPDKPLITHSPLRMNAKDVAALLLLQRDSLTAPEVIPRMPQEPQAHWAQAPASPPLDVVDTEKGAKEDEMADRPSSGQVSGEVAANEKQAAGDQTSDAHDLSRPSQVCEDEPFDMEKAIGGLGTTQRRLATLHATDALGISEQQAIYILETTAQAVIESCTTQFQQDHASVLSMAARLLLEMASYSKGMGQQQTAEEQSMAAGMISKVSFQIKMACQPQANGPSECPVTAGQTQSHSSLPAEETSQRDVVLDEQAIPSQCWGQQQVIREQATTAQTQWHPAKGQQIAVRDRATAAQVCYNANPKQCRPISEAESTSQKSFDRGHPMAKQVGLPRTGQQQVFREQATTAQMQWRPAKPASTGQQIAVREQAMAVQVCYNTDPKQCLPIFGAENTSQKPFDKGHPMAKQVGLPQCRGQQQIITEQVTTAQTQWHPVNGPASTSQQIAVGEQAMAVQICFNTVEKQCRPISEAGNTSQKSFDGEHPMAKQVGLPQCWGQQQLTREQAHTTAQMQWRPAKPASTGQQRAERQQAVAVQVCYNTDPKQCLPISEEENTSQQKSFAREPPMAIQACSGAAFTVGRKSQQKDVLKQRARTGKKRPRAAVTNKLGEESLMSSANGQAAAHHTSSSAASGNGPLDAIN